MPHRSIPTTPYEAYTAKKPDLSHLKIFGSYVTSKNPNDRTTKLAHNVSHGIFLGYTATDRNIIFRDEASNQVKRARHVTFDESHYHRQKRPPYAQQLYNLGELSKPSTPPPVHTNITPPSTTQPPPPVDTEIIINVDTQDTIETILVPTPITTGPSPSSPSSPLPNIIPPDDVDAAITPSHVQLPTDFDGIPIVEEDPQVHTIQQERIAGFTLTDNPYGESILHHTTTRGDHPTLGLKLYCHTDSNRLLLKECLPSTPSAGIPKWRTELRDSVLISVNGTPVTTVDEVKTAVSLFRAAQSSPRKPIPLIFAPSLRIPTNSGTNTPQINFDQMAVIARHHHSVRYDLPPLDPTKTEDNEITHSMIMQGIGQGQINPRLTRRFLQAQDDWSDWEKSEYKQLDSYESLQMFGEPCRPPRECNILPLIWTYLRKLCGTKKARCVCNGSPRMKGSVSLSHTYAAALEQPGARTFWALTALHNYNVYGADATNAFAEAPPPSTPLYVTIDRQYRDWWEKVKGRPPIPKGYVLPVQHALQGHPESPRLLAKMIDDIMKSIGFTSTTHEPCLYSGYVNDTKVFFLRQVDDFAISVPNEDIANIEFKRIQAELREPLKLLGKLDLYNGLDICQARKFVKIHCKSYLTKVLQSNGWMETTSKRITTPMAYDKKAFETLHTAEGPTLIEDQVQLAEEMGFKYRTGIGELLFAGITCRPEIMYAVIKLSQFSQQPAKVHYLAVKHIFKYLRDTIDYGIHYWRPEENTSNPIVPIPSLPHDNHDMEAINQDAIMEPYAYVDSDWAADSKTRKSVSGIAVMLAGGPIAYKSKSQTTIAHITTEAEFTAATDCAKTALYLRSIR